MDILKWSEQFKKDMQLKRYDLDDTIPNYCAQLKIFLAYFEKEYNHPRHIPAEAIKTYLLSKQMVNTQRHAHSAIKLFYKLTAHQEFKFRFIEYARKEKKLPQPLEEYEIQALINHCDNLKHKTIICILYACGIRVGELINLKLSHLEHQSEIINIFSGKGKKDRIVPYPKDLHSLVNSYVEQYNPIEWLFNGQYSTNEKPTQYTDRSVNSFLKQIAEKAGIKKDIHAHLLRHSYATHNLEQGVDIRYIQEILGHSSSKTTEIYTHVSKKSIAKIPSPFSNINLNKNEKTNDNIVPLYGNDKLPNTSQKAVF
jgi:integrase/recombinase XerD